MVIQSFLFRTSGELISHENNNNKLQHLCLLFLYSFKANILHFDSKIESTRTFLALKINLNSSMRATANDKIKTEKLNVRNEIIYSN